ncbi:MAG: flagellar basal body P-ring formation protein FlgA [Marinicaulis sp.]|nr:flagellar basal body P-ring formation protein FlgA [Marinicaulis sp.]
MNRNKPNQLSNAHSGPAFIGYLMIALWFLLTVMAPASARAEMSAAFTLTAQDILPEIEMALSDNGMPVGGEVALSAPGQIVSSGGPAIIQHISYNANSGRFILRIVGAPAPVAGVVKTTETYPMLTRDVARGDVIASSDIAFIETGAANSARYIKDADALIGMEARRPLRAETPLRDSDVIAPVLVNRGALVTVTFVSDGLRLSHQGVAQDAGAKGDVVAVENVASERTLKGVVAGRNLIRVFSTNSNSVEG